MDDNWINLKNLQSDGQTGITADIDLPGNSPWFSGHFPGFPILPGIAHLSIAAHAIRESEKRKGRNLAVSEIKKVRFRKMVAPGGILKIEAAPDRDHANHFLFTITADGENASRGTIVMREIR